MSVSSQVLVGIFIAALLVWVLWRLFSRRSSIPCPPWLAWLVEMENPIAREYNAANIIGHLDLRPGMTVLDAGCGPGRVTIPLAHAVGAGGRVVAADLQEHMLEKARAKAHAAGLANISFQQVPLGAGTLDAGHFDRALLVTVLGEIPDKVSALREIHRALKPNGILSVTEIAFDPHYQRRASVSALADAVGLREKAYFGAWFGYTVHLEKAETG